MLGFIWSLVWAVIRYFESYACANVSYRLTKPFITFITYH